MLVAVMPYVLLVGVTVFAGALVWIDYRAEENDRAARRAGDARAPCHHAGRSVVRRAPPNRVGRPPDRT